MQEADSDGWHEDLELGVVEGPMTRRMPSRCSSESGRWKEAAYIHNPTVDVSKLLQTKQSGAMGRIIECEALQPQLAFKHWQMYPEAAYGGGIDGDCTRIGC